MWLDSSSRPVRSACLPQYLESQTVNGKEKDAGSNALPPQSDGGDEHDEDKHGEGEGDEAKEVQK